MATPSMDNGVEKEGLYLIKIDWAVSFSTFMLDICSHDTIPDSPLLDSANNILFFSKEWQASEILQLAAPKHSVFTEAPTRVYGTFSLPDAMDVLSTPGAIDSRWELLDLLNLFGDCVNGLGLAIPDNYEKLLRNLRIHLFESGDMDEFYARDGIHRNEVRDGVYWTVGAIFTNARFF
jgi:hypothetical protein